MTEAVNRWHAVQNAIPTTNDLDTEVEHSSTYSRIWIGGSTFHVVRFYDRLQSNEELSVSIHHTTRVGYDVFVSVQDKW